MTVPDDIRELSNDAEPPPEATRLAQRREVGPESEVRGGSEAPDTALDEIAPAEAADEAKLQGKV